MVVVECRGCERLLLLLAKRFFSFPVCDRLGVSSLAFTVSFRCRHTVVAVDPSLIHAPSSPCNRVR